MKKVLIALSLVLSLSACVPSATMEEGYPMPSGLQGCKVYELSNGYSTITVTRCPTLECTSTHYREGKHSEDTSICQ